MPRVSRLITAPTIQPVTLEEVKSHCRISFADDDTILAIYIATATAMAEQILQRKLITQTWKMWLDQWPGHITPLFGDLQSVTHVKYTDLDEIQTTVPTTVYAVDSNSVPGRIVLKYGQSWPSTPLSLVNPIEVQFITGFGATTATVPQPIRNAVLLLAAHFYENREQYLISSLDKYSVAEVPNSVNALLSPYRVWEWLL